MHRRSFIAAGIALWATAPQLAAAQAGWILLGTRNVNWASGRDGVTVGRAGPFSALSFRSRGGDIFITNVEVAFSRGGGERISANTRLRPNQRSMPFRLRGPNRDIRRVDFEYRRGSGSRSRTSVEVFGRR